MSSAAWTEADRLFAAGDMPGARAQLAAALAEQGPDYDLLCALGVVSYRCGEVHAAKASLVKAMSADGDKPDAYGHLADLLAAEGEPERAEGYYWHAVQAEPTKPDWLVALLGFYQDQGLAYSAKNVAARLLELVPDDPGVQQTLRELDRTFPTRSVTVYVPAYNAEPYLVGVLDAVLAQSYPLAEVLVIDDGSTDRSIEVASRYPVRIITHDHNRGLSAARNTALASTKSEYLANLDADVLPDAHWLERIMLIFEADRMAREDGAGGDKPLGGVMGRLDELHDIGLPDQWRSIHMGQHHGDERQGDVRHLYGCNSVFYREALFTAGGYDELYRTNGEDCDASDRVRDLGYRLAYEPAARCRHLRRDTAESVLRTIWRYHTPYYEYRFHSFATGQAKDVMRKLPENISRHQEDCNTDNERRTFHLFYLTVLGLPWRCLSDLKLAAAQAPPERQAVMAETHAAVFCGLFSLLAELDLPDDLRRFVYDDLAPCRPADARLAELCSWPRLQAPSAQTLQALPLRDTEATATYLKGAAGVWSQYTPLMWKMARASAYRLRHEQAYRASVPPGALKVAVVNAPWATEGRIGVRAGSRWPFTQDVHGSRIPAYVPFPFFLATATAMLKNDGFDAIIIDAIAEGLYAEEFTKRLDGFRPDVILMETATASHEIDLDWCLQFKERLGDGVQVVLCGPHATALSATLMDEAPQVDAIVLGEYEPSFLELMQALRDGRTLEGIPGLLWRDDTGAVHRQSERRHLPPMSTFPWPERETLPMYNYFDSFANAMPWPNVQMHASRGCPFKCIFCVWPQVVYDGQDYRTRDNADIVEEMAWLVDRYGFAAVYFDDDTFNIKDERIIDLCNRIADRQLKVPICAMGRADTSSRDAFEAMKRAGLVGIKFGVETGDLDMMKRIRKHLDLDKVRRSVAWCKELGIGTHLTFSFGGPGETRETAEKTIRLACELDPDSVQFSLMTPFPGTVMYEAAIQNGTLLTTDWKQYDGARYTVVRGEYLTREELEGILREAHWRWVMHLAQRQAGCGGAERPPRVELAAAAELVANADDSLDVVQLNAPVAAVAVASFLRQARSKLRPGGTIAFVTNADPEQAGTLTAEQTQWCVNQAGLEGVACCAGFNGEMAWVARRPAAS